MAVGDVVQVDLIINQIDLTAAYVSQVDVHWVAISVKANVSERGVLLANKLRSEVPEKTLELERYKIPVTIKSNKLPLLDKIAKVF